MQDMTMTGALRSGDAETALSQGLAAIVGSRLCHDLISPLGAIGNGVELLQISGEYSGICNSPELQLIAESVEAARTRINWFRIAFGHAGADQRFGRDALAALLKDADRNGRIRIHFDAEGDLPRTEARMILLALMCLETAMAWGGRVLICRGASGWRLVAEADRIKTDPALWSRLDESRPGQMPDPAPSEVHFALLACAARDENRPIRWELDGKGGEISF